MKTMIARKNGTCKHCGQPIKADKTEIAASRFGGQWNAWVHTTCKAEYDSKCQAEFDSVYSTAYGEYEAACDAIGRKPVDSRAFGNSPAGIDQMRGMTRQYAEIARHCSEEE